MQNCNIHICGGLDNSGPYKFMYLNAHQGLELFEFRRNMKGGLVGERVSQGRGVGTEPSKTLMLGPSLCFSA